MRKIPRVITFIRHGQSKFNVDRNYLVRNCGLTKKGKSQSKKIKGNFDIIFISPLKRCLQTFEYSQLNAPKIKKLNLIREHKQDPCDFFENEIFKKENLSDCLKRVNMLKKHINKLPKEYQKICFVSHADFIWHYRYQFGSEIYGKYLDNTEIIHMRDP